ncbi:MAG: GTP-binding protein [Candidatus Nitrohelix vancouverensis]|uniref:GTP-binding protein n=1 Tax=Candidatus Nitrohelix vancouverensis TaxID=2705534 RepID=A0A7T0C495_9BACT|nr:MAG: GTP-binding protein [Candidatus Nitrohelix vancouverensis]
MNSGKKEIPVTLLTGFLGAGKTTLLNRILKENHGKRIAVIENEFGDVNIDRNLVIGEEEDIFEMSNGCICCSVKGDFLKTLNNLIGSGKSFDHIIIESSGLASAGPIVQAFLIEDELDHALQLDGIVAMIDSPNIAHQLEEFEVAGEQVAFAHRILLNKIDLTDAETIQSARKLLQEINPDAVYHETRDAVADIDFILNIGGFRLKSDDRWNESSSIPHQHGEEAHSHSHDADINSVSLQLTGFLKPSKLNEWLQLALINDGLQIIRAKGILNVEGQDKRVIFQSVYMAFDELEGRPWEDEERLNHMVFIGKNLDKQIIEAGVRGCIE